MSSLGDDARGLASMLASRADHRSVTVDRLAGTADAVSELPPVVSHLVDGEQPKFLFDSDAKGVGIGGPEATVSPERGGVFLFTDLRAYLLVGVADDEKALSLPYDAITAATYHRGIRRHRVELATGETSYHLWIPTSFDRDGVKRAVEYATYRHKQETPDTGSDEAETGTDSAASDSDDGGPQNVRERLERLGDAHSRGLIDTEEFERRKDGLTDG